MKKVGCAPAISEFTRGVDCGVVARHKGQAIGIFAEEGSGDLGVFTERVTQTREIDAPVSEKVVNEVKVADDVRSR